MIFPTLLEYLISIRQQILDGDQEIQSLGAAAFDAIYFYDQPLALHQFIPCDEQGKPMSNPKEPNLLEGEGWHDLYVSEYESAQQRALFEGWELTEMPHELDELQHYIVSNGRFDLVFAIACDPQLNFRECPEMTVTYSTITSLDNAVNVLKSLKGDEENITPTQSAVETLNLEIMREIENEFGHEDKNQALKLIDALINGHNFKMGDARLKTIHEAKEFIQKHQK